MMLGSESRGYCLEMICADFLAGANLDQGDPEILLKSISRLYKDGQNTPACVGRDFPFSDSGSESRSQAHKRK
jgi:hypothetical protein